MTTIPEPIVQPTVYYVNCLPEDDIDSDVFGLTVEYRGGGRWGVFRNPHCCLGVDGDWSWGYEWRGESASGEPETDEERADYHAGREAWLQAHRFDEETALRLAKEQAPLVIVNGLTVADALRMQARREERTP